MENTMTHNDSTAVAERPETDTNAIANTNGKPSGQNQLPGFRTTQPRIDGYASEDAYIVVADMPGVDESGVEVTLEKDLLKIVGEAGWPAPESFEHSYVEFPRRRYERTLRLADEIDRSAIEATVRNGVLRLTLPKSPEAKPTRISVTAGK